MCINLSSTSIHYYASPHNEVVVGGVYWFHFLRMSVRLSVRRACRVRFVRITVLGGFFPYLAQKITSMRGYVSYNDHWPWPIFSGLLSHDFAIKLLRYRTSCSVLSTACTALGGLFPYLTPMITSMRGYVDRSNVKVTRAIRIFASGAGVSK